MTTAKLTWKTRELPGGVRVDVADGVDLNQGVFEGKTYANQRFGPAALAVSLGPTEDLDAWRALFQTRPTLSRETKVVVCGQAGVRQEATLAAGPYATAVKPDDQGSMVEKDREQAAMTEIAVSFPYGGGRVLAIWRVETAERAAWSADEKHFFASISCK